MEQAEPDYSTYPSLELAYELALQVGEQLRKKYELIETRANALVTAIIAINASLITLASQHTPRPNFGDALFYVAAYLLFATVLVALFHRFWGTEPCISMSKINLLYAHLERPLYLGRMCRFLAEQHESYMKANDAAANYTKWAFIIALVQVVVLVVWLVRAGAVGLLHV
jgi:hypothetical protein